MHIRKVYGRTSKEVRQKAKKEFGDNISIIKMRSIPANKLQPDKGTTYELTIAIDNEAPTTQPLIPPNPREGNADVFKQAIERVNTVLTAGTYSRSSGVEFPAKEQSAQLSQAKVEVPSAKSDVPYPSHRDDISTAEESAVMHTQQPNVSTHSPSPTADNSHVLSYIGSELSEIRDVLHILLSDAKMAEAADLPDEVVGLHRKFLKHDIDPSLAYDLAQAMQACFTDEKGRSIHEHFGLLLKKIIKTSAGIQLTESPTIVALVGPTGIGKTTTLAKLAAQYRIQKKQVVLITTDDYRIGAAEQLETYADILSVPMEIAHEPEELEKKIADHSSADLILIDTPGRSQLDVPRIRSIESFLNAARPTETHLLLNMTTRNVDINSVLDRFGTLGIDRLIFTKLDESTCFGPILNSSIRSKKPISYLTTGQDVARDIEVATHTCIATLILRGFRKSKPEA